MSVYLSFKEVWRNRGRFFLFSLVIALITLLVLFIAGLGEGLSAANKEYLEKLEADLLVFQENVSYSTLESRLEYQVLKNVRTSKKIDLDLVSGFNDRVTAMEKKMGSDGRILVRHSGTEPVVRVMLEGKDHDSIDAMADELCDMIRKADG